MGRISTVPSVIRTAGSRWPARATSSIPVSGSHSTYRQVAKRGLWKSPSASGSAPASPYGSAESAEEAEPAPCAPEHRPARKREARESTASGRWPSEAYARTAIRSWPISPAARTSCPCTSPMTSANRPDGSGIMSYQSPPTWSPPPVGTYRAAICIPGIRGPSDGIIDRWSPVVSSRSDSATPARWSAWASIRATVVSTDRSSGEKDTGCLNAAIQAPMVRPATISGRKAQEARPKCWASGQVAGNRRL